MRIDVTPTGEPCGAVITGIDLRQPLDSAATQEIRDAWLTHHVLVFPDQELSDDDLERFTLSFGPFGHDPFFSPIEGREHIAAIRRDADETTSIFADVWHSDWSFQENPPAGTCLYGIDIPPVGGDTLFANQHLALDQMPEDLRRRLEGRSGIHSAMLGYSRQGIYGDNDGEGRSMDIIVSDDALATQLHPIIRRHPETGRLGVFSSGAYVIGIDGVDADEAQELLRDLYRWQTRDEFVYRHRWQPHMLVMWDNRSVLHRATGGYEGHRRLLHRTTIGAFGQA